MTTRLITLSLVFVALTVAIAPASATLHLAAYNYPMLMSETVIDYKGNGLVIDIVKAAAEADGLPLKIDFYPTKRALVEAKKSPYAGAIGAIEQYSDSEREQLQPVLLALIHLKLFYLNSNTALPQQYTDLNEFKFWRLSAVLGSAALPLFKAAGLNYETSDAVDNCFGKLLRQRVDLCAAVEIAAWDSIARLNNGDTTAVGAYKKPLLTYQLTVNFNKARVDATLIQRLQKGIDTIKRNGRYQQILQRYFGKNIPEELRNQ